MQVEFSRSIPRRRYRSTIRILWLPHQDWQFIRRGQREHRLAERLRETHDVHFLTWHKPRRDPASVLRSLQAGSRCDDGFSIHQARRIPNFLGGRVHRTSGRGLRTNEWLHQRATRGLVERERVDLVVCGISHQAVGLPPDDLPVPLVFDYLDYKLERWPEVEAAYLARADAVLCTSRVLVERVEKLHSRVHYLPNGVDLDAARTADGERVRRRYGLDGAPVISLIGLTASSRLFYIDAVAAAARRVPGTTLLLVGAGGELGPAMQRRAEELGVRTVATGPVPASEVADFFAASDVGLYPGDQTSYFDAASPLKILEYTAAGKPVVATDLAELRNWGFPNVRLAEPTTEGFAREIALALQQQQHRFPDLAAFSWSALAARLDAILREVAGRGKAAAA